MKRLLCLAPALLSLTNTAPGQETGWHQWRGQNRDGVSAEKGLLSSWPDSGPKLLWTYKGVGRGMASVSIVGNVAYTMGEKDGQQWVIALDLKTQKELWATSVSEVGGEPRCTPTVSGGLLYALSDDGEALCCQAKDGKEVWRKSFRRDFNARKPTWAFSESPLVDDGKVILTPGSKEHFIVALDAKTGKTVWDTPWNGEGKGHGGAGYTGAVVSNGGGVKQYVTMAGRGAISFSAKDGKLLWHYNKVANGTAVIPTPLVWENYVFVSSGYADGGAALLKLSKDGEGVKAEEQYWLDPKDFQNHHGGMVRLGDYIFAGKGHNNGFPVCIEWKTGKVVWLQNPGPGKKSAAMIAADGNLYFRFEDGIMGLVVASSKGYEQKGTFKLPNEDGPSWPHPALQDKKLYIRTQHHLMCYDLAK